MILVIQNESTEKSIIKRNFHLFCLFYFFSLFVQESISDFYWHYSGKDVVDTQVSCYYHYFIREEKIRVMFIQS